MYKPKNQERQQPSEQVGGVIVGFAGDRFEEAKARAREFVRSPLQWIQSNQPVRKAVLLEGLELLRPGIDVAHEHKIEKWKKPRR
jgi:hypothetical protein